MSTEVNRVTVIYSGWTLEVYPVKNFRDVNAGCWIKYPSGDTCGYGKGQDAKEAVKIAVVNAIRGTVLNQIQADILAELVNQSKVNGDDICSIDVRKIYTANL